MIQTASIIKMYMTFNYHDHCTKKNEVFPKNGTLLFCVPVTSLRAEHRLLESKLAPGILTCWPEMI